MKKIRLRRMWCSLFLVFSVAITSAQETSDIAIFGNITDAKGEAIPFASIAIKGTKTGTTSDVDGKYKITSPANGTLVYSFMGYIPIEQAINGRTTIDVVLTEDAKVLGDVVVTALGIKRKEKALTYSTQTIKGSELTIAKDANMMNSLTGKTAGVTINKSSSGAGGSVKVVLRGNRSAQGDNQPLYVVDGIPINSTPPNGLTTQPNSVWGNADNSSGGVDGGDGISNINPDDIESITVLKGASAAALYGSQAANGVVLITTKKGKAGVLKVDLSSGVTVETPQELPEFQNSYGQTVTGATQSWGPKKEGIGKDNLKDFYRTGSSFINSIGISGGTEKMQTYFSYANTNVKGIMPMNDYNRHNVTLRESATINKFSIDGSATFISQATKNRPSNGLYFNPLTGLYLFPRDLDLSVYKDSFEIFNPIRNLYVQNWPFNEDIQQNPYWIVNRNQSSDSRARAILAVTTKYDFTDWLFLQLRGTADKAADKYEQKIFATTHPALSTSNGRYILNNTTTTLMYGDAILSANKTVDKLGLGALVGSSITDNQTDGDLFDSGNKGMLNIPNYFNIANIVTTNTAGGVSITGNQTRTQLQAVFGTVQFSYDSKWFLDVTGRNDWASTLAFTPNGSYFYPSVGLTGIVSDIFELPKEVSYAKVRMSYAQVGSPVPPFVTNKLSTFDNAGTIDFNTEQSFTDLKPEMTKSLEFGTDWRFWENRLSLDFTYYKTNTVNQYFAITAPGGSGYSRYYVNAGNIQNQGVEVQLGVTPVKTEKFNWYANFNFAKNENKIIELHKAVPEFLLTEAGTNAYILKIKEGGSFGDIYAKKLQRNSAGDIYVDSTGKPLIADTFSYVGNSNPKWSLSMRNELTFGRFVVGFLIDGRFGGEVMSITQGTLDKTGVSKASGDARDDGGLDIKAAVKATKTSPEKAYDKKIDANVYYATIGGRDGATGEYIYSATNVRLRELSLAYSLPGTIVGEGHVIKNVTLALIGRNIFYFYKKAPYDPDVTASTGNGLQGVDIFGVPATRSIGLNLRLTF